MQLQKETEGGLSAEERELGVQVQPIGHSRFDLFSPFVTCPEGGEPLLRVGGDGDGMSFHARSGKCFISSP